MVKELKPSQERALHNLKKSLANGHRTPMVQMPTGAGKTVLASHIAQGAMKKNKRIVFCVPRITLINQTVESFVEDGITEIGVIQANHERQDYRQPVQIASIQTLQRRKSIVDADIVLFDEAHEVYKFQLSWMAAWNKIPFVGLSATPWTKGIGQHYDDLVIADTTKSMIERGELSDFRVYAPSRPDMRGVRVSRGDYIERDTRERMAPLTGDIVKTWFKYGESRSTFCFAVNRAHADELRTQFEQSCVETEYIDCKTPLAERERIKQRFQSGEVKVVCNVGVLTTGVDWDVRCIILAVPTRSEIKFVQMIGRGLRQAPGKADLLILDHSDNHSRLGYVTDIVYDSLDEGRMEKQAASRKQKLPRVCKACAYLIPAGTLKCPCCGYRPLIKSRARIRNGELRLVRNSEILTPSQKRAIYGELRYIQLDRHYAEGWVAHAFRERTGEWPNGLSGIRKPAPETWHFADRLVEQYKRGVK